MFDLHGIVRLCYLFCIVGAIGPPDISEYLSYMGLKGKTCSFVENFPETVNKTLRRNIVAQDEAIDAIMRAMNFFHTQRELGQYSPLVMAITGSTGIGKSETAKLLARGLYGLEGDGSAPCGLLMLTGKDYSTNEGMTHLQIQKAVKNQIIDHLLATGGDAIIVFDEIQSILPGILQVIAPALDESFPFLSRQELEITSSSYFSTTTTFRPLFTGKENEVCDDKGVCYLQQDKSNNPTNSPTSSPSSQSIKEVTRQYNTGRCIFLFVSDIGADVMTKLLMKAGDRKDMSIYELRNEIKRTLDQQWERLEMFTKSVNEVIPYLPLEPIHIQQIFTSKLLKFMKGFQLKRWLTIHIEEDVVLELTSSHYIGYNITTSILRTPVVGSGDESNQNGTEGTKSKKVMKRFARNGARNLEKAGPLQDLKAYLSTFRNPERVLHIGMITNDILDLTKKHWDIDEEDEIYFQWCLPDPTMLECTKSDGNCEKINFSQYMNAKGQISMYLWNKLVLGREENGYDFKVKTDHTFNSAICDKGVIWKPQ